MLDKLKKTVKMTAILKGDTFLSQILTYAYGLSAITPFGYVFSNFRKCQIKFLILFAYQIFELSALG